MFSAVSAPAVRHFDFERVALIEEDYVRCHAVVAPDTSGVQTWLDAWAAVVRCRLKTGDPRAVPMMMGERGSRRSGFSVPDILLRYAQVDNELGRLDERLYKLCVWAYALKRRLPDGDVARLDRIVHAHLGEALGIVEQAG